MLPLDSAENESALFREINISEDYGINPFQNPPASRSIYERFIQDEQLQLLPEVKLLKGGDVSAGDFLRIVLAMNRHGESRNFRIVFI